MVRPSTTTERITECRGPRDDEECDTLTAEYLELNLGVSKELVDVEDGDEDDHDVQGDWVASTEVATELSPVSQDTRSILVTPARDPSPA